MAPPPAACRLPAQMARALEPAGPLGDAVPMLVNLLTVLSDACAASYKGGGGDGAKRVEAGFG